MLSRFSRAFLVIIFALFLLTSLAFFHAPSRAYLDPWTGDLFGEGGVEKDLHEIQYAATHGDRPKHPVRPPPPVKQSEENVANRPIINESQQELDRMDVDSVSGVEQGGVIMKKLGNATAKAELGRATWKLLHTMTLRYPEKPIDDERDALKSYFHLLSRLYPCGECAAEFQQLLKKFPVQTSSRRAAATWLCFVHNQVNERLKKPEFDCANLDATYDCGCGDDPLSSSASAASSTATPSRTAANDVIGHLHDPMDDEYNLDRDTGVGLIKGGR